MSNVKSLQKQNRQMAIVQTLTKLEFATRSQLQKIHDLGGARNANRVLSDMTSYLHSFRHELENVYYLNKLGREIAGMTKDLKKTNRVQHTLMRNDMYIHLGCPNTWETERPVNFTYPQEIQGVIIQRDATIMPDAQFKDGTRYTFVEIDNLQSMRENKKKLEMYKHLARALEQSKKVTPLIIFYTVSLTRKQALTNLLTTHGLKGTVYTKEDLL